MGIKSKKQLGVILSQLKGFENPNWKLEQYPSDADIASEVVWWAYFQEEIEDKVIADLGCGTGILGLSTLMMGAKKVFFVDIDKEAIATAKENLKFLEEKLDVELADSAEFVVSDVENFDEKVDLVIQNPPFGIKHKAHADKVFLEKAFTVSDVVYSFHKAESKGFIDALTKDKGFSITNYFEFNWPLKQTMHYHKKKIQYIKVGCWRLEKS